MLCPNDSGCEGSRKQAGLGNGGEGKEQVVWAARTGSAQLQHSCVTAGHTGVTLGVLARQGMAAVQGC